jgi:hypothetical protein
MPVVNNCFNYAQTQLKNKNIYQLILLVFFIIICAIRIHLLPVALERDEGEYAYSGQLILQGIPPFAQAYNMKMPGIYVAYAAVLGIFGQTSASIHFGLLIINLLCSFALYLLGKRLYNSVVGGASAIAFAAMSLSSSVLGLSANAEYFVLVFALFGILLLLLALDKGKYWIFLFSGCMLGICFLMKQHGAAFIGWGLLYLVWHELRNRTGAWKRLALRFGLIGAGIVLPFALMCLWLWRAGAFKQFWFWTFTYARAYVSQIPLWIGLHIFNTTISHIILSSPLFWILGLAGLVSLLYHKSSPAGSFFAVSFFIFSFASICPGFYFREHYFILLLPAVSLLSGIGLNALCASAEGLVLRPFTGYVLFGTIIATAVALTFFLERHLLFQLPPQQVSRAIYGINPFPESCVIADSLKAWTSPKEKIAVIGSEPQIFFYSHRRSATGYIYTYALMEYHPFALRMQEEMIREIESVSPKYIVYVNVEISWLVRPRSYTKIFEWFNTYQKASYEIAGVADIVSPKNTVYAWGNDAKRYTPRSSSWVAVFKRKAGV